MVPGHEQRETDKGMTTVDLSQLREGESGRVVLISGGHGLIRRLESLGIRVGKRVTKISAKEPFKKRYESTRLQIRRRWVADAH